MADEAKKVVDIEALGVFKTAMEQVMDTKISAANAHPDFIIVTEDEIKALFAESEPEPDESDESGGSTEPVYPTA